MEEVATPKIYEIIFSNGTIDFDAIYIIKIYLKKISSTLSWRGVAVKYTIMS